MVDRYRQTGADVRLLSEDGKRPVGVRTTALHLWRGLKKVVRAEKPDAAHVQYMAPGALPILILRTLGVKKIIATSHTAGDIYSKNGLRVIRFLTRHLLTAFQCITLKAEESFFGSSRLFDGTLSKHFTIYNNIPSHISIRTEPRKPLNDSEPITVGVVSRLEPIKGMDLVVPAFANAAKENPRLRLLVVGDGSQRQLMEQQTIESGLSDRIKFVGRKTQSELQDWYDRIDILLMPSRSEGFGLTAIEGMACGCVPVVANVGGLPEVVVSDCGYIHKPEDIDSISDNICMAALSDLPCESKKVIKRAGVFSDDRYKHTIKNLYNLL